MTATYSGTWNGRIKLSTSKESWIFQPDFLGAVADTDGIFEAAKWNHNQIQFAGNISVDGEGFAGIRLFGFKTRIETIINSEIAADTGIALFGSQGRLVNGGSIVGESLGIDIGGTGNRVENTGSIQSQDGIAVRIELEKGTADFVSSGVITGKRGISVDGAAEIVNTGSLIADAAAIKIETTHDERSRITNDHGTIASENGMAIKLGGGRDKVVNIDGTIEGTVELGSGNDVFEARSGSFDVVRGGKGDDLYIVNSAGLLIEKANGGSDTVKSIGDHTLSANFETLILIHGLDSRAFGNLGDNVIIGNTGSNTLDGRQGNDILTGGKGHDVFIFQTGDGKDTITDFKPGSDALSIENWTAITDFHDLKQNYLVVDGDDLVIKAGPDELRIEDIRKSELIESDINF